MVSFPAYLSYALTRELWHSDHCFSSQVPGRCGRHFGSEPSWWCSLGFQQGPRRVKRWTMVNQTTNRNETTYESQQNEKKSSFYCFRIVLGSIPNVDSSKIIYIYILIFILLFNIILWYLWTYLYHQTWGKAGPIRAQQILSPPDAADQNRMRPVVQGIQSRVLRVSFNVSICILSKAIPRLQKHIYICMYCNVM